MFRDNSLIPAEAIRLAALGILAAALQGLLRAQLRAPLPDFNRLALLLKLRFLHHLPAGEQHTQLALMAESLASERARLEELRRRHQGPGLFGDWLDHDIALMADRIAWLRQCDDRPA